MVRPWALMVHGIMGNLTVALEQVLYDRKAEPCNYRRSDGSKQSISLDSRDSFADRVKDIISDQCTIVYTDFACHVAPIMLALRDRDV